MNKEKLEAVMKERGFDKETLAKATRLTARGFEQRVDGDVEFNLSEIVFISKALSLTCAEIEEIFFDQKVL